MKLTGDRKFDNEVHDDDVVGFERSLEPSARAATRPRRAGRGRIAQA